MDDLCNLENIKCTFEEAWRILKSESSGSVFEAAFQKLIEISTSLNPSSNNYTAFNRFCLDELKSESYVDILCVILKSLKLMRVFGESQKIINSMTMALKSLRCDVNCYNDKIFQVLGIYIPLCL